MSNTKNLDFNAKNIPQDEVYLMAHISCNFKKRIQALKKDLELLEQQRLELIERTYELKNDLYQDKLNMEFLKYKPVKGDPIDETLAKTINEKRINLPIERIEAGKYLFGTKSVQAKLVGDKVVIRVGGGWMSVEQFSSLYGMEEIHKVAHHSPEHNHGHGHGSEKAIESNHFHVK